MRDSISSLLLLRLARAEALFRSFLLAFLSSPELPNILHSVAVPSLLMCPTAETV